MADVFVSYARNDEAVAVRVVDALRSDGYAVWRDDELPAHLAYADVIEERLKSAKAVVVLWSAEAARSQWVRAEADTARSAGTIVQASIDGSIPPLPFNQIQCADLSGWDGKSDAPGWAKLKGSVRALAGAAPADVAKTGGRRRPLCICVLPFQNMSGDPEQEYFAEGMVEEIINALCRIRWLFVIARNSTYTYKGQPVDAKQVGRELGVRYLLEGSVRKAGDRVRITAQLIDTESGTHLSSDRFDGSLKDVFDLQEKVAISVAGVIEPTLQTAETDRSAARPTGDLTAYDLYLRSYATVWSSAARIREALRLAEQAIARDPRYGMALAWAAFCCLRLLLDGQSQDQHGDRRKGAEYARRALEVAGDDPAILANAAQALAYFGEEIGVMMALADRALGLNPSYARGWLVSGLLRLWAGQPDIAIEHCNASLRLSPRGRNGAPYSVIGLAHLFERRFDQAVPNLLLAIQEDPTDPRPYRNLAACYAHMGRLDDARQMVEEVRSFTPDVIQGADYLRNPEHRELFLSGLRIACGDR